MQEKSLGKYNFFVNHIQKTLVAQQKKQKKTKQKTKQNKKNKNKKTISTAMTLEEKYCLYH